MQTNSNTVDVESASHTDAHSRVILSLCCAAPGAVAARYLMHLSIDYCSSCRETLSAALLRCCCRATRANVDLLRTRCIRGRHQQRVVRFDELLHGALELHSIGASLRRRLFYGGEASTPRVYTGLNPFRILEAAPPPYGMKMGTSRCFQSIQR